MTNDEFVQRTARSIRLYQRGLIAAQEFTNVTIEDMHRLTVNNSSEQNFGPDVREDYRHEVLRGKAGSCAVA